VRKLLAVAGVLAGALAIGIGPAGAILGGQPDGDGHPYVGLVTDFEFVCSGGAVSPTMVITAAHCFESGPGSPVAVSFNEDPLNEPASFVFGTWWPHDEWCNACGSGLVGFDRNDIAVVVLDEPIDLGEYGNLPALGQAAAQPQKQRVSLVGYGIQDRVKKLDPGELLTRHFAPAELVQSNNRISEDFLKVSGNHAKSKGGSCLGDSGSPIILEGNGMGNDTFLAVTSFGPNGNCAGNGYANRLDIEASLGFIDDFED
jgi:hypothetical protein